MARDTGDFQIPDGPPPRPFMDFLVQGGIALVMLVVLVQVTYRLGQYLGPLVPFAWEKQVSAIAIKDYPFTDNGPEAEARRAEIQKLVDQLLPYEGFPAGMTVTVHYSNQEVVNAFATLGGNMVVYEGLLERLPSENALSMVLGHEMSHIAHRDAMRSIGADQLATLIVGLATGDSNLSGQIVSNIQLLTSLQFSREIEERADSDGLKALYGHYHHVNGYLQTFDALEDWVHDNGGDAAEPPEFLRDHPDTASRKLKLAAIAEQNHWPTEGHETVLRQANFLPKQKFGAWGAPADSGLQSKALPKDTSNTNYKAGETPASPTGAAQPTASSAGDSTAPTPAASNGGAPAAAPAAAPADASPVPDSANTFAPAAPSTDEAPAPVTPAPKPQKPAKAPKPIKPIWN